MRKSPKTLGWQVLAEIGDSTARPSTTLNIRVSGEIGQQVSDPSFLELTWPLAREDTFGSYTCHVTAVQPSSGDKTTEMTPLIQVIEAEVNAGDLLLFYERVDSKLANLKTTTIEAGDSLSPLDEKIASLIDKVEVHGAQVDSACEEMKLVDKSAKSALEEMTGLERDVDDLERNVGSIDETLSKSTGKVFALEGQITSINDELNSIGARVDDANRIASTVIGEAESFRGSIQTVSDDLDSSVERLSKLNGKLDSVSGDVELTTEELLKVKVELERIKTEIPSLDDELENMSDQISSLIEAKKDKSGQIGVFEQLHSWPEGEFSILRPASGCPVDLTFNGQRGTYFQIHTESSNPNLDEHPAVLGDWTRSKKALSKDNFITLWFCESNGVFNTEPWPKGSYCINRLVDSSCPSGFTAGNICFHFEERNTVYDFTSRSVSDSNCLSFCCRDDGLADEYIELPTHRPFLLYRLGDECQAVQGMRGTSETLYIDTEGFYENKDEANGAVPDHRMASVDYENADLRDLTFQLFLCHYTKQP